jgi:hypothetical protein
MTKVLNDCGNGVLTVLSNSIATPHRSLSEDERVLLFCWCGTDRDPTISKAIKLFNATIVGVDANHDRA